MTRSFEINGVKFMFTTDGYDTADAESAFDLVHDALAAVDAQSLSDEDLVSICGKADLAIKANWASPANEVGCSLARV